MKKITVKQNLLLLGMVLLGVAALAAVGAWEHGTINFLGMVLLCMVSGLALYMLLNRYQRLCAYARHSAARRARQAAARANVLARGAAPVCKAAPLRVAKGGKNGEPEFVA